MKRSPSKLTLRCETLRALASLDLTRVIGGDTALPGETGAAMCSEQAFTGAVCTEQAVLKS
jgi:hypothetical protein